MSDLEYPAGLRYTAEHEWVSSTGDTLRVGRVDLVLVHAPLNQVETTLEVGS